MALGVIVLFAASPAWPGLFVPAVLVFGATLIIGVAMNS